MRKGIKYEKTNERRRAIVSAWGSKPSPMVFSKTKYKSDIRNLQAKNLIRVGSNEIETKFTIGMEVEKLNFTRSAFNNGDMVGELPLFLGYETDSTCGVEAVTNVLPLLPASAWRTKIFGLMHDASSIIEDTSSPSDYKCGGHVTIGVKGKTSLQLLELMRRNIGIVYALFRKRLPNQWCHNNTNLIWDDDVAPIHNGDHYKYTPVKLRNNDSIEFRLVSRFQSVKQMKDRYKLFYELVDFSINNPYGRYSSLIAKLKPILMSMYNGDVDKVDEVIELSKHFRKYLVSKGMVIPPMVRPYVDWNGGNAQVNRRWAQRQASYV